MRINAPGMAVDFNPIAAPLPGECGCMELKRCAESCPPCGFIYAEIANPAKVASQSKLGNEMKRDYTDDYVILSSNQEFFIRMGKQLCNAAMNKRLRSTIPKIC